MAITIGSNIASLNAQRRLGESRQTQSLAFERLSSGLRINRASDDAAGLSVAFSQRVRSAIFGQSIKNVNDGVSLVRIQQSATSELSRILTRLSELATQSANGVYSPSQRVPLSREGAELRKEFNRIIETTTFNGVRLLDEDTGPIRLQAGFTQDSAALYLTGSDLAVSVENDGTFGPARAFGAAGSPSDLASADFNGDGKVDVALAESNTQRISILFGNGDGTFGARTTYLAFQPTPDKIAAADFTGDGLADLITGDDNSDIAVFYRNLGNGTFAAGQTISLLAGNNRLDPRAEDVNGDGKMDILYASHGVKVAYGQGDGTFAGAVTLAASGAGVSKLEDFNGDGRADFVSLGGDGRVFLNQGNGAFLQSQTLFTFSTQNFAVNGDFNGDGRADVFVYQDFNASGEGNLFLGNGDGTFRAPSTVANGLLGGQVTSNDQGVSDVNGDGIDDLVVSNHGGAVRVLFGSSTGTLTSVVTLALGGSPSAIDLVDVDGNETLDILAVAQGTSSLNVFLGNGGSSSKLGQFSLATRFDSLQALELFAVARERLSAAIGRIGAEESRVETAGRNLLISRENTEASASRILDADFAEESAVLVRSNILQQVGAAILAQANQIPALANTLLA